MLGALAALAGGACPPAGGALMMGVSLHQGSSRNKHVKQQYLIKRKVLGLANGADCATEVALQVR